MPPSEADLAALERYATALVDAVDGALGDWVVDIVGAVYELQMRRRPGDDLLAEARAAGEAARADVVPRLRELLALDIDEQRTTPLTIVRTAVAHPTAVLRAAGVPPVDRIEPDERRFPDDVYGIAPASMGELGPSVGGPGLAWGAAKAHVHLQRRGGAAGA